MYPDKKQLELLIELQSIIKAKMGEWRIGDYGYIDCHDDDNDNDCINKINLCIDTDIWHERRYIRLSNSLERNYLADDKRIIRVPAIIDPINPERGLWGMIDWKMWFFSFNGTAFIENEDKTTVFFDADTATVLLNALYIQEVLLNETKNKEIKNG
jgi:hypothetical protein